MTMDAKQSLLITGGTGSFGTSFLRSLLDLPADQAPGRIIVFSRDEEKQHRQRSEFRDARIEYVIGDVRNAEALENACRGVDIIVHAAALKQVPTGEFFPDEAIKTNLIGAQNVVRAARTNRVAKVIGLSTDKAVYPINVYGMTKALAEKVFAAACREHACVTIFVTIRYGNVMGSRGSVIPLFLQKIEKNEPLTVTDGDMTRFLLKLDEAILLVHHAIRHGQTGDLFVRKSPACTIDTLVRAIELHFGRSIPTERIGIRPGEKMNEVLLTEEEAGRGADIMSEDGFDLFRVHSGFQQGIVMDPSLLARYAAPQSVGSPFTSNSTRQLSAEETLKLLKEARLL